MFADTYALILFKQGKPEEALKYQEVAVGEGLNNDMNERYIEFLVASKKYKKAEEKAEEFIRKGAATQKTKDLYKTAFLKNNPDKKEFETKLAELEKIAHDKQLADIKKKMIDEKGIDFTLKDLDGKSVSLSSLKGKIVILDFWATWCGPCKASFPGMQKVVNKYKADDSVVILFVDTFERGKDRTQKVADFIKKNNYSFHVLFDNQLEDSNDFEVAPKYGITGIPTKIIIGPDGNIKFRAVGYSGNTEKLVDEMDMMIELLKQ
jgi:thiol-disulfide isomerase/thioredoxin